MTTNSVMICDNRNIVLFTLTLNGRYKESLVGLLFKNPSCFFSGHYECNTHKNVIQLLGAMSSLDCLYGDKTEPSKNIHYFV